MRIYRKTKFLTLPQGIMFDLDNTFYSYNSAHTKAQEAVTAKAASMLGISKTKFREAMVRGKEDVKKTLGSTAASHSRILYFQRALEFLGLGSQPFIALDFEQTYWSTFLRYATLFEGVIETLASIRSFGIKTAVVTDLTAQIQFRKLIYFGLDRYIDFVVTSEEVGRDKPSKAIFARARDKLGCDPDKVWMVGDNPTNDIEGARLALNATTIQKVHFGVKLPKEKPDAVIRDFVELSKIIAVADRHEKLYGSV